MFMFFCVHKTKYIREKFVQHEIFRKFASVNSTYSKVHYYNENKNSNNYSIKINYG